jgi:hypothetical protein
MVYGSGTFDYAMCIVALQASSITLEVFTLMILNLSSSSFVPKPCLETLISEASCYLQNVQLSGLLVGRDIHCMVASRASE